MSGTGSQSEWVQHAPHNAMDDPGEIARFYDCCSVLMRELLNALAAAPERPRCFPEIEDSIGWPRRRIASVLGGVWHLRTTEFSGRRPYRFIDEQESGQGDGRCGWTPRRRLPFAPRLADNGARRNSDAVVASVHPRRLLVDASRLTWSCWLARRWGRQPETGDVGAGAQSPKTTCARGPPPTPTPIEPVLDPLGRRR